MTPAQAAYRAGCIVAEIDARFGLTPTAVSNCSTLPNRLPVILRHVWGKAVKVPEVLDLLDGFDCPDRPFTPVEGASFWIGFYHQKTARALPADFGGRLKALRDKANLSMQDLADASGVSKQVIHNCEAGKSRPTWDVVQALASALGVSTDVFRDRD